jgi:protease I
MAHIVMVVAPQQFRDEELLLPRQAFEAAGHTVQTVSTQAVHGRGMLGHEEAFTATLNDVELYQTDALVIVGGYGAVEHLWPNTALHALCQQVFVKGGVIGALCVSPVVLAKAGLLNGKRATVWSTPDTQAAFDEAGAQFTGDAVTIEGNLITGNGPDASVAFAEAVLTALLPKVVSA